MTDIALNDKRGFDYHQAFLFLLLVCALLIYLMNPWQYQVWWSMLVAYILGAGVYYWERSHYINSQGTTSLLGYLFPRKIWLHPSSLMDGFAALLTFGFFIYPHDHFNLLNVSRKLLNRVFPYVPLNTTIIVPHGVINHPTMVPRVLMEPMTPEPSMTVIIIYSISAIVLFDLLYYFAHRMTHAFPILWEFHKVHHSAEVMTPMTGERFHPVDTWFTYIIREAGFILLSCVFLYFYPRIRVYTVLQINLGVLVANFLGANLRHSHIWLRLGKPLEHIFVSPALHHIHHSADKKHFNKNYASLLSLWDWIFGSLYIPEGRENITFGLGEPDEHIPYRTMSGVLFHPIKQAFRIAFARSA